MYLRIPANTRHINGLGACQITNPVLVRHVICSAADLAEITGVVGRPMSAAQVRAAITKGVNEAVKLLTTAAASLHPRPARGTPERDRLDLNFREAFGVASDHVPSWRPAGQTWDRGGVVRERLRCAARILSNGSIKYHCWGPRSCPADDWTEQSFAKARPGELRLCFGENFWTAFADEENDVVLTMLHEALHIYFELIVDPPVKERFANVSCYERFVLLMNKVPVPEFTTTNCASTFPKGDFPPPRRDVGGLSSAIRRPAFNYQKWMPHRSRPLGHYGLGACATGAAAVSSHAVVLNTIKCELERKFSSSTDPKLLLRRLRLRELFNAVSATEAKDLAKKLRDPADPLGTLLRRRVAPATRNDMLTILFLADYDLNFQPGTETVGGVSVLGVDSNPRMTASQKTDRITDVETTVIDLLTRRDDRATKALTGTVPAASSASAALKPMITRLSTAQLELFREHYPDGSGGIKLADYGRGFEQFANGELRDPALSTKRGPNGGFFFLFAEFGFLCADSGIDVAEWTRILRVFVASQEIFMHVFRPGPHKLPPAVGSALPATGASIRTLDAFSDTNFDKKGQSKEARKIALRKKYAGMNLTALKKAAGQNMLRAQRMT